MKLSRVKECFLDLLFPPRARCFNCGELAGIDHDWFCDECLAKVKPGFHSVCPPQWPADGISRAWFSMYYQKPISNLVRAFKYEKVYSCVPYLISLMEPVLQRLKSSNYDVLMPVPLHYDREWKRGFNQSAMLADRISERLGIPVDHSLKRCRNTHQQAGLSLKRRHRNLNGAFSIDKSCAGLRILLVDDVVTSGSTGNHCARVLREAGAADVQLVAVLGSRYFKHHKVTIYYRNR